MADEPDLQKGQSGEWVQYLQQLLQQFGYWQGEVDGEFGDELEQAVMQVQAAYGMAADGMVGQDTWNALTGGGSAEAGGDGSEQGEDEVYIETSYLPITQALMEANGDVETYVASLGIDVSALTQEEAIA
jgi:peptidoglycan hydrolase-like protein with peptidoglycan-binding domain